MTQIGIRIATYEYKVREGTPLPGDIITADSDQVTADSDTVTADGGNI